MQYQGLVYIKKYKKISVKITRILLHAVPFHSKQGNLTYLKPKKSS